MPISTLRIKEHLFKTSISKILLKHISGSRKNGYYPFQVQTGAGKTFSATNLLIYVSVLRLFGSQTERDSVSRMIYTTPRVQSLVDELGDIHKKINEMVSAKLLSSQEGMRVKADICLLPGTKDILNDLFLVLNKKPEWAHRQNPGIKKPFNKNRDKALAELFCKITGENDVPSLESLYKTIENAERRSKGKKEGLDQEDVAEVMRKFLDVFLPRGEDGLLKEDMQRRAQRIVMLNTLEARVFLPSLFLMDPDGASVIMMSTTRLAYPFSNRVAPALFFGKKPEDHDFTFVIDESDAAKSIIQDVLMSMKTQHKFNALRLMQRFAKIENKPFYEEENTNAAIANLREVSLRVCQDVRTDLLLTVDDDTIKAGEKMTAAGDFMNLQAHNTRKMIFSDNGSRRIFSRGEEHPNNDESLITYLNRIHISFDLEVIPALQIAVSAVLESIKASKRTQTEAEAVTTFDALNHFLEQADIDSPMLGRFEETDLAKSLDARLTARGNDRKKSFDPGFVHTRGVSTISFEPVMRRNILSGTAYGSFSVMMSTTPNKFLLNLAQSNLVIGMSATATVRSATANFSLSYLEGSDALIPMTDDEKEQVYHDYLTARDYESAKKRGFQQMMIPIASQSDMDLLRKIAPIMVRLINEKRNPKLKVYVESVGELLGFAENKEIKHVRERIQKILNATNVFLSDEDGDNAGWRMLCLLSTNMEEKVKGTDLRGFIEVMVEALGSLYGKKPQPLFYTAANFDERKKECATAERPIILITTYQNAGAGFNIQQERTEPDEQVVNVHRPEPQRLGEALTFPDHAQGDTVDFDTIYCERVTNPISANGKDHGDVVNDIYALISMNEEGYIEYQKTKELMTNRVSEGGFSTASLGILKENIETSHVQFRYVSQAFGRLSRTSVRRLIQRFMVDQQMIHLLRQIGELSERENSQEIVQLFKELVKPTAASTFKSRADIEHRGRRVRNHESMRKNLQKHERSRKDWAEMRQIVLKDPTYSGSNTNLIRSFYIKDKNGNATSKIYSNRKSLSDPSPYELHLSLTQTLDCMNAHESSEEASRLPKLMQNPIIKAYFMERGYATTWVPGDYVLDEFICQAVYTGAVGEEAVAALLHDCGISIDVLPEKSHEFFDMMIGNDYPIDVKNYGSGTNPEDKEVVRILERSSKKARDMGKSRCAIVSIFPTANDTEIITRHEFDGIEVVLISGILQQDNQVCPLALNTLIEESMK